VMDARLRPDGEKGLLVNTLDAYEDYYRRRAMLWEIQAISRNRPVAGNLELGRKFQQVIGALTNFAPSNAARQFSSRIADSPKRKTSAGTAKARTGLAAYTPDWRKKIREMRERIEKERTPAGEDALAIKTGSGGLMDAEFMAQTFCLANGWQEPNTLRALVRARDTGELTRADADVLIENYRRLRSVEGILRRWSYEGETLLPDEDAPYYRVSVRCGFGTPEEFREAIANYRKAIRAVYNKVL
jgi:[glutamine synthetase] adenylyltransferase / [glutamine synthetase]-adenylyl-L-tyrosine phosphorylase